MGAASATGTGRPCVVALCGMLSSSARHPVDLMRITSRSFYPCGILFRRSFTTFRGQEIVALIVSNSLGMLGDSWVDRED